MPPKVKELIERLEQAGFANRGGKGSQRNFVHPKVTKPITVSGKSGDDARQYLVKAVEKAITESKK
ncbi:type II toxin-antitoxin system HicA family toxin [uncultured Thiodictyon sp.]|uniref:type II toxin-antitoxin system HicA family toxin n=1 Tax=uncultured Thiodictyon sp. TaxID=1846217 RepID=UPI0025E30564|nr:type II toxin-antitoxin system HicA family toxin [uncultured Thiodictyon sp.]